MADLTSSIAVALPALQAAGTLEQAKYASGDVALPALQASGQLRRGKYASVAVTLPALQVGSGHISSFRSWTIAVTLPLLGGRGSLRLNAAIYNLTGAVRATGDALLCFVGPQDRAVEWVVVSGGGALYPFTAYTDPHGRAYCRYEAGGYVGPVTIRVRYGA